jgi:hypothetical protein
VGRTRIAKTSRRTACAVNVYLSLYVENIVIYLMACIYKVYKRDDYTELIGSISTANILFIPYLDNYMHSQLLTVIK